MNETDFYTSLVLQARNGDRTSALNLLDAFVESSAEDVVILYVKACLTDWINSDCDPLQSGGCFNVARPDHRPVNDVIGIKHSHAMRAYILMRGRGKGREKAIEIAATVSNLSESSVKKLLEKSSGKRLGSAHAAALIAIVDDRVRWRCRYPQRKRTK
jgi:hypothetical protein